ncbi:hypothetical protein HPP92_008601 [Vanilla planifolia]|uniref:DUF1475 domain-containing protein n=1 Tax=Vanilla planifolia TaxID=51239 RepID=A0A835RB44_VANPL|nr:hypothetical protein HPP92_008789 [Vanilla planifolia]KAG0486506.1 hypothetical protein HPP92_008601 [Vanilla planifolia]
MAAPPSLVSWKILFSALGCFMLATLVYTILTDGSPFRRDVLTPWMSATLVDFYINVFAISVWVWHKESSMISAIFWILLLICTGSIATCAYIVVQLFKVSTRGPFYHALLDSHRKQSGDSPSE